VSVPVAEHAFGELTRLSEDWLNSVPVWFIPTPTQVKLTGVGIAKAFDPQTVRNLLP
jgi:hypothetical protein